MRNQTRNGFGQSYVRPVVSAPLRTASVDRVAERASRPLLRPAWQIFSKAYHHRRSLSVFFVTTISQDTHIPKKSTWVCFGSRGESRRKAQFYCCRLGILPCFIFFFASALLARVLSIAIIIAARRDKQERLYSQAKDGRRKFQPFVRC